MIEQPLTVSAVNGYLRALLESDPLLSDLWITGEVSNWSQPRSGHCYFTLKDEGSEIRCVMWRSVAERLVVLPRDGDAIVAAGYLSIYEERGQYQFYVAEMQPLGLGVLFQRFEALKQALQAEGLFADGHKRPLPAFPQRIGVVTSPTAAALQDMLNVLRRRHPMVEVLVSPTLVQGASAPAAIVRALQRFERVSVDLIIVARGGGSLEDLWAFNDESVARAIHACRTPVICGVGHEVDVTIADFVADCRAPTPSAAAELAVPDIQTLREGFHDLRMRLDGAMTTQLATLRRQVSEETRALDRLSPLSQLRARQQNLDYLAGRLDRAFAHTLERARARVRATEGRLHNLDPRAILDRGYAVVTTAEGARVRDAYRVAPGTPLQIRVQKGALHARTEPSQPEER